MIGGLPVQRTLATGRSVELDALVVARTPVPAPDALTARDEKAGAPAARCGRARGPDGPGVLPALQGDRRLGHWCRAARRGRRRRPLGVVAGDDPETVVAGLLELMKTHRVWERFATSPALGVA